MWIRKSENLKILNGNWKSYFFGKNPKFEGSFIALLCYIAIEISGRAFKRSLQHNFNIFYLFFCRSLVLTTILEDQSNFSMILLVFNPSTSTSKSNYSRHLENDASNTLLGKEQKQTLPTFSMSPGAWKRLQPNQLLLLPEKQAPLASALTMKTGGGGGEIAIFSLLLFFGGSAVADKMAHGWCWKRKGGMTREKIEEREKRGKLKRVHLRGIVRRRRSENYAWYSSMCT